MMHPSLPSNIRDLVTASKATAEPSQGHQLLLPGAGGILVLGGGQLEPSKGRGSSKGTGAEGLIG